MGRVLVFRGHSSHGAPRVVRLQSAKICHLQRPSPRPFLNHRIHPRAARHLLSRRLRHVWLDHVELAAYRREMYRYASGAVTLDEAAARVVIESALGVAERAGLVEHFTNRRS